VIAANFFAGVALDGNNVFADEAVINWENSYFLMGAPAGLRAKPLLGID
jgi:hypothetical protein